MGYHFFIHDQKALPMGDGDVALIRHFLIEGASRLGETSVARAIVEWEYQGPGVWVGVNEAVLGNCGQVFAKGIDVAEELGEVLSVEYLNENVKLPGGRWLEDQAVSDVVERIRSLDVFLNGHA